MTKMSKMHKRVIGAHGAMLALSAALPIAPAFAQTTESNQSLQLQSVTVTAQRRTENIRDVRSHGFETFVRGQQGPLSLGAHYAYTRVETDRLAGLSKYVDDYAPHGIGADAGVAWPGAWQTGIRVEHRRPYDRGAWTTVDLRVARPIRRVTAFVEVANLGDVRYEEIRGVDMPGRWARAGIAVR